MRYPINEDDEYEYRELARQDALDRQYERELFRHPDCRDPDHPGCKHCIEEDEDD